MPVSSTADLQHKLKNILVPAFLLTTLHLLCELSSHIKEYAMSGKYCWNGVDYFLA